MNVRSARHAAVLEELSEWWEDVRDAGIGSQVVLLEVPRGWGRSTVLNDLREAIEGGADGPVTFIVSIGAVPEVSLAVQAQILGEALATVGAGSHTAELLGLDTAAGKVQAGLGVGGLFASGLAAPLSLLLTSLATTAAGNAWDASPAGQQGSLARAARAVAAVSVAVPVAVIIDDAETLDPGLAAVMIENLAGRYNSRVLVVAAVTPGSSLAAELRSTLRYELAARVQKADTLDADPGMGLASRTALVRELLQGLPDAAVERIGLRTRTFGEVFTVTAGGRLAEVSQEIGAALLSDVDIVIDAELAPVPVSEEAAVLAWAGGALHVRQADRALEILGADHQKSEQRVIRAGSLARLADQPSAVLAMRAAAIPVSTRRQLAAAILEQAISVAGDPDAALTERVVAQQAAHRVRIDLDDRGELTNVQCILIRDLEALGDPDAARDVATTALAELREGESRDRAELLKTMLRLASSAPNAENNPLIDEAIAQAAASGALLGLEARVWAAVSMLNRPGPHDAALALADQVAAELADQPGTDATVNQWRLMLAFQVGQAGHAATSQRLLAPIIDTGTMQQQEAAQAVLYAIGGPRAGIRLQIVVLEAELSAVHAEADDDLLRIHSALAANFAALGDFSSAVHHGRDELAVRHRLQHADNPQILAARASFAIWTGYSGKPAEALQLLQALLLDLVRVLGPDHRLVLTTRSNIAYWTGQTGRTAEALGRARELLPDIVRVLGRSSALAMVARVNIADWTGDSGNWREALRLGYDVLPDLIRLRGPDHHDVFAARGDIASWTGNSGSRTEALRLFQQLLTDRMRVEGPDHPEVLRTRSNLAFWTGMNGDTGEALRLVENLLPDRIQVLGPDHPDVLATRASIALWTGRSGNIADALRLYRDLLPDRIQVLGPDHPDVLATRASIGFLTGRSGNIADALRLYRDLLPDQERVLGPGHPGVLASRATIAALGEATGHGPRPT
jgi:hypothetical protein